MAKKKAQPYFTDEQAQSLVRGEEHRLLIRQGRPSIGEVDRLDLIKRVAKVATFEEAIQVIADAI